MENKTVSVHIVMYNSSEDILDCLQAVSKQVYPIEQVVIIDNSSSDQSVKKVKAYVSDNYGTKDQKENLILLQNQINTGFAPAHNQAISITKTDYVLVLNPDVTLASDYVSKLIARMEMNSKLGSATGKLLLKADPKLVDSTGIIMNKARRAFDRGAGESSDMWNESGFVLGASGAAAMYSRRMIDDISVNGEFFDADFFAYKEDVDVAWRAQILGWQAYFESEALGYHERGWKESGRSGKSLFIRRYSYINRYKMIYKNERLRTFFKTLLISLPYEIAAHGYILMKEPNVLKAWGTFFSNLPSLRVKRKIIKRKEKDNRS